MPTEVKVKKRCCQDKPRCKRCPVVLKRLETADHAERLSKRRYRFTGKVPKKALKLARAR